MASSSIPRVAVIGGGIAGTLAAMVLHHRGGVQPIVLDAGRRVGGRLLAGTQTILRATHPSLVALYTQLAADGILQQVPKSDTSTLSRWGILGSSGGGFLSATQIPPPVSSSSSSAEEDASKTTKVTSVIDQGDFCHFIEGRSASTFLCTNSSEHLCANLLASSGIETHNSATVDQATPAADGWHLTYSSHPGANIDKEKNNRNLPAHFDGMVVATHNPSFAADIVQGIVQAEQTAGTVADAPVLQQLHRLATDLNTVRTQGKQPVFTWRGRIITKNNDSDSTMPFDTVTVPGSPMVQFLTRMLSSSDADSSNMWTAVSTSTWAAQVLERYQYRTNHDECLQYVQDFMTTHVQELLQPHHSAKSPGGFVLDNVSVKRWGAAFTNRTLGATHAAIALQPWRLTIAGDYVAAQPQAGTTTPIEAAALSGLVAGEQTAAYFTQGGEQQY